MLIVIKMVNLKISKNDTMQQVIIVLDERIKWYKNAIKSNENKLDEKSKEIVADCKKNLAEFQKAKKILQNI